MKNFELDMGIGTMFDMAFYKGKRIIVTGHTGFKGTWLCKMLIDAGADVTGYALEAPTNPSLFEISQIGSHMNSIIGDIRDYAYLQKIFANVQPEIVFHLAAQPLVIESYVKPQYTYEVNVMGTVNLLESIRNTASVKSVVNITTDKVYKNNEWDWGYRENDLLDGYDPYSNSKSCAELVTGSYKRAFLDCNGVAVSTVRAGNVIGGGDFAKDRIIPDCIRYAMRGEDIVVRNPYSIRPYQHVLEPLYVYLMIAAMQYENMKYAGNYNVGPDEEACCSTMQLVELFMENWREGIKWINLDNQGGVHEAKYLKLDCSKLKNMLNWRPKWNIQKAVEKTVDWTKDWIASGDVRKCMEQQINEYLAEG